MKVQGHLLHQDPVSCCHRHVAGRRNESPQAQSGMRTAAVGPAASPAARQLLHRRDWGLVGPQSRAPSLTRGRVAFWGIGQHMTQRGCRPSRTWISLWRTRGTPEASSSSSVAVSQYLGQGPYTVSPPVQLRFVVGQGRSSALDCSVNVFLPRGGSQSGSQRCPLLVLSAGFLLHSGMYGSYATDLASWGLAIVLYDLPELVDDVTMVSALGSILDACISDPRIRCYVDSRAILLAGHSRGGKLSVLAAASDPRVRGIALLDPVDVTSMTPMGPGYPSALPAMGVASGPPRSIPALIVGAARNTGVIPVDANFQRFLASCRGPCWFLELTGAGHLQFLDAKVDLLSAFVESGPTPDEAVRRVSKAAVLAWALELAVPLARVEAVNGRQVLERLQQTTAMLGRQAPLSWSFKGFDVLGGPASGADMRTSDHKGGTAATTAAEGTRNSSTSTSRGGAGQHTAGSYAAGAGGASSQAGDGPQQSGSGSVQSPGSSSSHATSRTGGAGTSASSGTCPIGGASIAHCGGADKGKVGQSARWTYEELMQMRARELKAILVDLGVDCSDCFEKADLANRIVERC